MIDKKFIENNLLTINGTLNSNKTKNIKESPNELYDIYHNIKEYDKICTYCKKNNKSFINFKKGYTNSCGEKECIYNNDRTIKIVNSRNQEHINDKLKIVWENKSQEEMKIHTEKTKKTKLEKYGNETYNNPDKNKNTCIEKYGKTTFLSTISGIEKTKKTKLEKYGNETYNNPEMRENTNKIKYGKKHKPNFIIQNEDNLNIDFIKEHFIINGILQKDEFMIYFNCKETFMFKYLREHNIEYTRNITKAEIDIKNIFNFLTSNNRTVIKPLEIDLLSEDYKFGIEYNGMMFHSYGKSTHSIFDNYMDENKKYHLNKTLLMEDRGYQLYHIFENEWKDKNKQDIWISMINSKIGLSEKIPARKCNIKEVSNKDSSEFINKNHLQGNRSSSIRIGLYYNDELVSIMTFGKPIISKKYQYELYRMCNKIGINVIGGFSKMLKYFERKYNPISLMSYANRRWSQGNVYDVNGFTFSHNSMPNMNWFKTNTYTTFNRMNFQKHKLKDIEGFVFDEKLTAKMNMFNNGYRVIYDCGNKVYFKVYNKTG